MTQTETSSQPTEPTRENAEHLASTSKQPFSWLKIIILTIVILLLCLAATGIYFGHHEYKNLMKQNKALQLKTDELTANILKIQQNQQNIQNIIKQLRQSSSMSYYLNLLSTTDQLVTAANLSLKTENNIVKALDLLNTAIRRIRDIHEFSAITQSLESDINTLKTATTVDQEKIIVQLNNIARQINTLNQALAPSKALPQAKETPEEVSNKEKTETTWQKISRNITQSLRNVIIISHKENIPVALTSSQLANLKLNLHTLLLETVLAVNKHQANVYQTNLKEIADLLQIYFPANEEVISTILPTIKQLQQIDINMAELNLDNSLKQIETTLEQKSIVDVTSAETIN